MLTILLCLVWATVYLDHPLPGSEMVFLYYQAYLWASILWRQNCKRAMLSSPTLSCNFVPYERVALTVVEPSMLMGPILSFFK